MPEDHRKRRRPVMSRGRRVTNLYVRPKSTNDIREGETYEVVYRDPEGRQRQKTLRSRTLHRAMAEAEEYRTQLRRGEIPESSRLTFEDAAAEFFAVSQSLVASGERSRRTVDLYRQRYAKHIHPVLGRRRIQDVRAEHIATIFARQRESGLAAWTVAGTQTIISAVLTFAQSRAYITSNPLDRVTRLERPRQAAERQARRLSDSEVRSLCEHATPSYSPVITLLAWTGLRVSEALGLTWNDIDLEGTELHVRHALDETTGALKRPKTTTSVRAVPLLPVVVSMLKEHRKSQLHQGLYSSERLVFTTATGKPMNRHNVRNQGIVPAATKAGLHGPGKATVTTHDLRRTFLSHLILGLGLDPVRVAKIAGHSNPSMTLNVYAEEFDKALHRDDLFARIEAAGLGAVR
jgi:integrase